MEAHPQCARPAADHLGSILAREAIPRRQEQGLALVLREAIQRSEEHLEALDRDVTGFSRKPRDAGKPLNQRLRPGLRPVTGENGVAGSDDEPADRGSGTSSILRHAIKKVSATASSACDGAR